MDEFITIACVVIAACGWVLRKYFTNNVYLTYKNQRVGGEHE